MKKILFVSPHLIAGGVERALLNLINILPEEEYNIHLSLVHFNGKFLNQIPDKVILKYFPITKEQAFILTCGGAKATMKYHLKKKRMIKAFKVFIKKIFGDVIAEYNGNFKKLPVAEEVYDVAVCYHMHMPFIVKYVAEKVTAGKKFIFIHNDFLTTGFKVQKLTTPLKQFDNYFCVGQDIYNEFTEIFPKWKAKTSVFYNVISTKKIHDTANKGAGFLDEFSGTRILTIGRLNAQKGFFLAIDAAEKLLEKQINFRWYVLGEGELKEELLSLIKVKKLEKHFLLLGITDNPYGFMKQCDIYAQTSLHEAYCTTINEARILHKPIVTTDVAGAAEMLDNGKLGIICQKDATEIAESIKLLIQNKKLRLEFTANLQMLNIDTADKALEILAKAID
ncbi:MAG: glycosyltransferase [Erysipelotrichales bacterium]|nr:glycosyltransferase [Erysipelotrichales bacterium]